MLGAEGTTNLLVLDYLLRHGYLQAFNQLQLESRTTMDLSPEVALLRRLTYHGNYTRLESFLQILGSAMPESKAKRMFLCMQRQRLYQQIESPEEEQILQIFKGKNGLEDLCRGDIGDYYYLLTLDSMDDEIEGWTVQKGRLQCFEEISRMLEECGVLDMQNKRRYHYHLEDIVCRFVESLRPLDQKQEFKCEQNQGHQFKFQASRPFPQPYKAQPQPAYKAEPQLQGRLQGRPQGRLQGRPQGRLQGRLQPVMKEQQQYINQDSQCVSGQDQKVRLNIDFGEESQLVRHIVSQNQEAQEAFSKKPYRPELRLEMAVDLTDPRAIRSAHFSEGRMLATASAGTLQVYQLPEGRLSAGGIIKVAEKSITRGSILDVRWRNQKQVLTCSNDNRISLSVLKKDAEGHLHNVEVARVKDCTLRGALWAGDQIISYNDNSFLQVWDPTRMVTAGKLSQPCSLRTGTRCGVNHMIANGWSLFTANQHNSITAFDIRANKITGTLQLDSEPLWLELHKGELFCAASEGLLYIFDQNMQETGRHRLDRQLKALSFCPDGLGICSTQTNEVALLRMSEGLPMMDIQHRHAGQVTSIGWRGCSQCLSTGTDGICRIYSRAQ